MGPGVNVCCCHGPTLEWPVCVSSTCTGQGLLMRSKGHEPGMYHLQSRQVKDAMAPSRFPLGHSSGSHAQSATPWALEPLS